ncbi:hypothetical protein SNEBB_005901 [Seison nebaliae]|nr:hypothetical protein SNEBB_005901 [Seison nebaliae]
MTQYLPRNLLALFDAREPIAHLPPVGKLPHEKKRQPYTGIANYVKFMEEKEVHSPVKKMETRQERQERKRLEKTEQALLQLEKNLAFWNPKTDPNCKSDPYKTLFVSRLNYETPESKLRREFEEYGPIKEIYMIYTKDNKPRGYAFIEYENKHDMHNAYKNADGIRIDGRSVVVDCERGRTVEKWIPRRLGGGLGGTRRLGNNESNSTSDRNRKRHHSRSPRPHNSRYGGGRSRKRHYSRENDRDKRERR